MKRRVESKVNYPKIIRRTALGVLILGAMFFVGCDSTPPRVLEPNQTKDLNPSGLCVFRGENIKTDGYIEYVDTYSYETSDVTIDCGDDCSMTIPGSTYYTSNFNLYFGEIDSGQIVSLTMRGKHEKDFQQFAHVEITGTVSNKSFNGDICYISSALVSPYKEKIVLPVEP